MPIHMQESYRPPNRQDQKDNSLCDVTVQTLSAHKKSEHTENCRREGTHIKVSESSMEALKIIMLRLIFVHVLKSTDSNPEHDTHQSNLS